MAFELKFFDHIAPDWPGGVGQRRDGEARRQLALRGAATDAGALLDHNGAQATLRQPRRTGEPIDAAADYDRIVAAMRSRRHLWHQWPSFRMRSAAFLPGAPMMPPPGCVADPHMYNRSTGVA